MTLFKYGYFNLITAGVELSLYACNFSGKKEQQLHPQKVGTTVA